MGGGVARLELEHAHEFRPRERRLLLENEQVAQRDMHPWIVGRGLGRRLVVLLGLRQLRVLHRRITGVQVVVDRFAMASGDQPQAQRRHCRQREWAGAYESRAYKSWAYKFRAYKSRKSPLLPLHCLHLPRWTLTDMARPPRLFHQRSGERRSAAARHGCPANDGGA